MHEGDGLQPNGIRSPSVTNPYSIWALMTTVYIWRLHGECLNPAFYIQAYTAPTTGVIQPRGMFVIFFSHKCCHLWQSSQETIFQ